MEKPEDTSFWLQFFKEAGIPSKTGASYAHIFIENRIHKDMLSDLTVDYLRLMGITLMGDIIAILRHSKSVHQDSLRKVVILKSKEATSIESSTSSSSESSSSSSSDEDIRTVAITKPLHRKTLSSTLSSKVSNHHNNRRESYLREDTKQVKGKVVRKQTSSRPKTATKRTSSSENKTTSEPVKRKHDTAMDVDPEPAAVLQRPATVPASVVAQPNTGKSILKSSVDSAKKIRVTAENNVIGPKLPPPKKTVFERLGSETSSPLVSSTTVELVKPEQVETRFTRIIDNSISKMSSVFDRLGGVDSSPEVKVTGPVLKYAGVLKSTTTGSTVSKKLPTSLMKKVGTMRADEPVVSVKLRAATTPVKKSLKIQLSESSQRKRLALQQRSHKPIGKPVRGRLASAPSEGIFANPYKSKTTHSVKQRLGSARPMSRNTDLTRIRRSERRSSFDKFTEDGEPPYTFSSRVEMRDPKRVSFGNVEQKVFSPVSPMYSSREPKAKVSIHRRLGAAVRYK